MTRTPEIGDIWEVNKKIHYLPVGTKVYITSVTFEDEEYRCLLSFDDDSFSMTDISRDCFVESYYTYLGKSKINLSQIFEVKDE